MDNKVEFIPPADLVEFAAWFSSKYKNLSEGDYYSLSRRYKIRYAASEIFYLSRVRNDNNKAEYLIEINPTDILLEVYTPNFVFFIIIWSICLATVYAHLPEAYIEADLNSIGWYATTGRQLLDIPAGISEICAKSPSPLNIARLKHITDFIKAIYDNDNA